MSTLRTFHIWKNGQSTGPFTIGAIKEMIQKGTLSHESLVASAGDDEWLPLATYADLLAPVQPMVPSQVSESEMIAPGIHPQFWPRFVMAAGFAIMTYFALFYGTAVGGNEEDGDYKSKGHRVNNLGLMSNREVGVIFGGFLFLAGCMHSSSKPETK